ncbi:MAG TPA: hypothetical protein DDZ83_00230 [Nitrospinae bacterium]|nr:hypothetical protein [Nitrospinota bacterium]
MKENFFTESFEDKYEKEARINVDLSRALEFLSEAGECHKNGDIDRAIDLYKNSIAFCPTADAHTYLGWMYSAQDRFEEAIEECHLAIEVDPDFGNPYNDIGCYLMELKEIDEAAEWFEKAKTAPRYEPRHFPYMNIARIHLTHARYGQACGELYQALKRAPGEASLRTQLLELLSLLN